MPFVVGGLLMKLWGRNGTKWECKDIEKGWMFQLKALSGNFACSKAMSN